MLRKSGKSKSVYWVAGLLYLALLACSRGEVQTSTPTIPGAIEAETEVRENILVDGSSTVFPISEAMAQKFMAENPEVRITVGLSSSRVGFKTFCIGDTDISNASRPMNPSEKALCETNTIEYVEIPVAFDGIAIVVNRKNDWIECLTLEELAKIWQPPAKDGAKEGDRGIVSWKQVREEYPEQALTLYGPDTDSGTYDYFTNAVTGEAGKSRQDYRASEYSQTLIQAMQSDRGSLGFVSFAYYEKNKEYLKLVGIDSGSGHCLQPSQETIADGSYASLSRPLFLYINKDYLEKNTGLRAFAESIIDPENRSVISETGYVPLPDNIFWEVRDRL